MLFSAPHFFVFFAGYYLLHRLLPIQHRLWLIVLGGSVFYAWWIPVYAIVPHALMLIGFLGALWVAADLRAARTRLILVISALMLPLIVFKYTNFLHTEVFGAPFGSDKPLLSWPLPLGISFVTFTLIAYVVDVARGRYPVERRLGVLDGYVVFFPHLIAGPILRPHELLPQLDSPRSFAALPGIAIFSVGLAKKLIIADQIAAAIDPIYADPARFDGWHHLLALYGFAVQIYCDFSGYTDMAIGLAILLGVRLPNNFRQPYAASSIVDFWRRWHITLSHWLRDYLYIPLGGNRSGRMRQVLAIMITMALGGLWHGANWTFLLWGVVHGAAVSIAHLFGRWIGPLPRWIGVLATFHLVALAWVLFRSPNMSTAKTILFGIASGPSGNAAAFFVANGFAILLIGLAFLVHRIDDHRRIRLAVRRWPRPILFAVLAFLWILAITVSAGNSAAFIYYDF